MIDDELKALEPLENFIIWTSVGVAFRACVLVVDGAFLDSYIREWLFS
jgi:hypothetical protein